MDSLKNYKKRKKRGAFPIILLGVLIVALVGGAFGIKALWDNRSASSNAENFARLIAEGDFNSALHYYYEAENGLEGSMREKTLDRFQAVLDRAVRDYSEMSLQGTLDSDKYSGLGRFGDKIKTAGGEELRRVTQLFCDSKLNYARLTAYYDSMALLGLEDEIAECREMASGDAVAQECFANAEQYIQHGEYLEAIRQLDAIPESDADNYARAAERRAEILKLYKDQVLEKINTYIGAKKFDSAKELIDEARKYLNGDADFARRETDYNNAILVEQKKLVTYNGPVEHLFFHCLIAFPELAFLNTDIANAMDRDYITAGEFKKIVESLYKNGYILISPYDVWENYTEDGAEKVRRKTLMLPKNKKPLIISVDNVVYDSRKAGIGLVDKLIVDEEGKIATYTKHADGTEVISRDNEIMPIIDEFVYEHPDFSYNGAKGIIALTGYAGVFGYHTQRDSENRETEIAEAKKVAECLKENGWIFASNSYSYASMGSASADKIADDTEKWKNEVANIVGETMLYIWPYGNRIDAGSDNYKLLTDAGYRYFFSLGYKQAFYRIEGNGFTILQDRRNVDGFTLRVAKETFSIFYDAEEIIDPLRPESPKWYEDYKETYGG